MNDDELFQKLKIPKTISQKIFLINAIFEQKSKKISLNFESKSFLSDNEIVDFFDILQKNPIIKLKFENIKIKQPNTNLTASEFYGYFYLFIKKYKNEIKTADFFIKKEENENNLKIIVLNQYIYKQFIKIWSKIEIILKNFHLFNGQISIEQNGKEFERSKIFLSSIKENQKALKKRQNINNNQIKNNFKKLTNLENKEKKDVYFEGEIIDLEIKKTRTNNYFGNYHLKNDDSFVLCTLFFNFNKKNIIQEYKVGNFVRVYGKWTFDNYRKTFLLSASELEKIDSHLIVKKLKINNATPRTELHIHTKMSAMDGVGSVSEYFKYGQQIFSKGLAFVDHNSVQSYPEIYQESLKYPEIQAIYGVEFDVFDDINTKFVENEKDISLLDCEYVFFDLETTGISVLNDEIIEFGAVKWQKGHITDKKQLFIKSERSIPKYIEKITNINDQILKNAPKINEIIKEIKDWIGDAVLVAHNAKFDYSFLDYAFRKHNLSEIDNPIIDTLKVSWLINPGLKNHRLGTVARYENQNYDEKISHRADYDALILQKTFDNILHKLFEKGIRNLTDFKKFNNEIKNKIFPNHITVLAKNQSGIKDIYKLISEGHINYFNSKRGLPVLPLSLILKKRKNLLLGSACKNGLIWEEINYQNKNISDFFEYFDYIEIHPPEVYSSLIKGNKSTKEGINKIILEIIEESKKNNKKIVVTSNAHYLLKTDKEIREVYIVNKGLGGKIHPLYYSNFQAGDSPEQHLYNNDQLLEQFNEFIDDQNLLEEIIFRNPNKILEMIDKNIKPIKKDLYPPTIENAKEEFLKIINQNLIKKYGKDRNPLIDERLETEIEAITKNNYEIIYYISSLAVKKSLNDGYLVGSRGSVGSSFAATMLEITEVNPLPPHYLCSKCKYHQFVDNVSSGYDLPDKKCPKCNEIMKGEGHEIPFETFLGFKNAKKVPDIDLNFSREYQAKIHNFIKTLLGEEKVFRAGTISTVAQKTAYGYVKNWIEKLGLEEKISTAKINYLVKKVEGTKRTTGQHPGGLIVIPKEMEIYDFSPINFPGNDLNSKWKTTHFDFHSIHDNLLKLDLLGHLDPSSLRMLHELTKIDPKQIPMNDNKVLSLFLNNKQLKYQQNYTNENLGILGISEFGTKFVREIVRSTKPKTFSDLVRISGLSHGTDVWNENAKFLIDNNITELKDVISVRDDIMIYLMKMKLDDFKAFQIMESVRKGKGLKNEWKEEMLKKGIPQWYLDSSEKIKYIFPKAHAIAYVIMAYRIAWYKINFPLEYYATYFSKRDTEWDVETLFQGIDGIKRFKDKIKDSDYKMTDRDKSISETYNILSEMYSRGYNILPISLEKSKTKKWIIDQKRKNLIPPFSIIEGLGESVAKKIVESRKEKAFENYEDFKIRSGLNKTLLQKFIDLEIIKSFQKEGKKERKQLQLFS